MYKAEVSRRFHISTPHDLAGDVYQAKSWGGTHPCPPLDFLLTADEITKLERALRQHWSVQPLIDPHDRPVGFWFPANDPKTVLKVFCQALGSSAEKLWVMQIDRAHGGPSGSQTIWPACAL